MNPKSLLAICISLLFRESQLPEKMDSKEIVKNVITNLKINNGSTLNVGEIQLEELKNLCLSLIEREMAMPYIELMQRLKIACGTDTATLESIQDNLAFELPTDELKKVVLSYRYELSHWLKRKQVIDNIEKLAYDLKFNQSNIEDIDLHISSKISTIQDDLSKTESGELPGLVTRFKLSDIEKVAEQFDIIKNESAGSRIIKMPWQAMNRATQGGIRLGEFVLIGGLPYNGKSYVSRSMFAGGTYYTNPQDLLRNKEKKPLNVILTLEDKAPIVMAELYILLKGNLENEKIDIEKKKEIDKDEAARYVLSKLSRNGYEVEIIQVNPDEMTYMDIQNMVTELEADGYEIHMCLIDYLNLVSKKGLASQRSDTDIQELFRRVKNFMLAKGIATLAPHQLSADAMELKRSGKKDLARIACNLSMYEGNRTLGKEPDLEFIVDKVIDNGIAHMCISRGKHKGINDTPEDDRHFILPFAPIGGLRWDIEGMDTSMTRFGATRNENGEEELAFWDVGI